MKVDWNKIYFIFKAAVILSFAALLFFLAVQKVVPNGVVEYKVTFDSPSKFIYGPYPGGRIEVSGEGWILAGEPVYFKIYAPKRFSKAEAVLKYKNPDPKCKLSFGVKVAINGEVPYLLKKVEPENVFPDTAVDVIEKKMEFDLRTAAFEKNKLQFTVSSGNLATCAMSPVIVGVDFLLR
jgi:hypothetical protein